MVTPPVDLTHPAVMMRPESLAMSAQRQRQSESRLRRRFQPYAEKWPWSLSPREDARVPAPHEAHVAAVSPVLMRLSLRTAVLMRHNQQLQMRLTALQAETDAVLRSLKKKPNNLDSPPSSPESSLETISTPCSPAPPPSSSLTSSPASSAASSPSGDSDCDFPPSPVRRVYCSWPL